mgnify:CR=1 FL=1
MGADETLRIVFLGPPGSGKGTQAERLSKEFGVPAISTGEMLRTAVAAGDELGQRVEGLMSRGELVDDGLMAEVVKKRLAEPDAARGFVLDGYPRTASQADTLDDILSDRGQELDHVLLIAVPEERLVERALLRQRDDDREDVVRERLLVYRDKTEPLVERYREAGLLREIDGNQTIEQVGLSIRSVLG